MIPYAKLVLGLKNYVFKEIKKYINEETELDDSGVPTYNINRWIKINDKYYFNITGTTGLEVIVYLVHKTDTSDCYIDNITIDYNMKDDDIYESIDLLLASTYYACVG